ncbi:MAG: enoyl-CoA hydratase/isomerase family protein, partial [Anaerotignaceae bacterium]
MDFILYEKKENIALITINRPEVLNAMSTQVLNELIEALDIAEKDMDILAVILTGAGEKAFSAGGDVKEELKTTGSMALKFCQLGHDVCTKLQKHRVPIIAAVNGYALGGGMEFALACDMVYAADTAKFGLPSVKLGILSGFGGTQNLTRIVGKARAKEIMFTGRIMKADEVYNLGIVQKVVPKENLMEEVMEFAKTIAAMPPFAIRSTKEVVNAGSHLDMDTAYLVETKYAAQCYDTEDKCEAMTAFLEK